MRNIYAWIKNSRMPKGIQVSSDDVLEIKIHYKSITDLVLSHTTECTLKPFVTIRIKHTSNGQKPIIETKYH